MFSWLSVAEIQGHSIMSGMTLSAVYFFHTFFQFLWPETNAQTRIYMATVDIIQSFPVENIFRSAILSVTWFGSHDKRSSKVWVKWILGNAEGAGYDPWIEARYRELGHRNRRDYKWDSLSSNIDISRLYLLSFRHFAPTQFDFDIYTTDHKCV